MMTSSPGSTIAINAAAIASVAPQVTVSSVSGSTVMPYQSAYLRASASRSRLAPQVMAYWLMSARIAREAASLMTSGAGKLGKPCARLMAPCSLATRVIQRMTDSVKPWVRREVCMDYESSYGKGVGKRRREEASRKGVEERRRGEASKTSPFDAFGYLGRRGFRGSWLEGGGSGAPCSAVVS